MSKHKHADTIKANLHKFKYKMGKLYWADNYAPRARKGQEVGSVDSSGYLQVGIDNKQVLVHRIIWVMFNSSYPEQIDHIDRNRLNNLIENLRAATNTTNQHNVGLRKDNTSGSIGVNLKHGKYQARIQNEGKRIHLGTFDTIEEATIVYNKAKEKYHAKTSQA